MRAASSRSSDWRTVLVGIPVSRITCEISILVLLVLASSSRRQSGTRIASASTASTGSSLFTGVHQRPPKTGWVVAQLVTQPSPGAASSTPPACRRRPKAKWDSGPTRRSCLAVTVTLEAEGAGTYTQRDHPRP
jgi:hypothetical protein